MDPRTPVIVGVAQVSQREDDLALARLDHDLQLEALLGAANDAGRTGLLGDLNLIGVVAGGYPYPDPGRLLADAVGASGARTILTGWGGQTAQSLVSLIAGRIQAGECELAAVVGGEAERTRRRREKAGLAPESRGAAPPADEFYGSTERMVGEFEIARHIARPITAYPLIESRIRHRRGEDHATHRDRIARFWKRFGDVALTNPHGVLQRPVTVEELRDPSPSNRMVGFPYTKLMCANNDVDMASGMIIASAAKAEALGIPKDRWVFLHAGVDSHDTYLFTERWELDESPGIRLAGAKALTTAGRTIDEIGIIELYSCFPSIVQVSMKELGIAADRTVTVTGGLTLAGGPLNNYVGQAMSAMVERVRAEAGTPGLLHGNGGLATKHAIAVYSTEPPDSPFRHENVQVQVDALPARKAAESHIGPVTVEAYTVMHDHGGPTHAICALRTPDDARTWGRSEDPAVLRDLMVAEGCGRSGGLDADGVVRL